MPLSELVSYVLSLSDTVCFFCESQCVRELFVRTSISYVIILQSRSCIDNVYALSIHHNTVPMLCFVLPLHCLALPCTAVLCVVLLCTVLR